MKDDPLFSPQPATTASRDEQRATSAVSRCDLSPFLLASSQVRSFLHRDTVRRRQRAVLNHAVLGMFFPAESLPRSLRRSPR